MIALHKTTTLLAALISVSLLGLHSSAATLPLLAQHKKVTEKKIEPPKNSPSAVLAWNRKTMLFGKHLAKINVPHRKESWKKMIATWYDGAAGLNGTGTGITASGARAVYGTTIAVDPKIIPFGSIVEVKFRTGKKHCYIAQDTGGAITANRLDIFDPSQKRCIDNGVQSVLIKILKSGKRS